jgi:hypothetical protein
MNKGTENIFYEKIYLEYQKEYHFKSKFNEIVLSGTNINNDKIEYPITIETIGNTKYLNSYSNPIHLDNLNLNLDSYRKFLIELKSISKKNKIKNILFKKSFEINDLEKKLQENKKNINLIGVESIINLNEDLESIKNKFSKGHKSALKINYENLKYEIFDKNNYQKNQILEMMDLHKNVSGKSTRSKETWKINEKMILENKGLLIRVNEKFLSISFAFIFFNKDYSIYFSSCTNREKFKSYKNITHKIIWEVIKYLKIIKCKQFNLGITNTYYSNNEVDQKNKNISLFKSSFGGEKKYFTIYNNLDNLFN